MQTFAEIWERNACWLLGPGLLGDVIEYLRGRAPIVVPSEHDPSTANLTIPLPDVRDAISGELRSIYFAVPPELQSIFEERCDLIIRDWFDADVDRVLREHLGRSQMKRDTLDRINFDLRYIEREREYREEPLLWEIAANRFGFSRWALPKAAGMSVS